MALERIVANAPLYDPQAVEAAQQLLDERLKAMREASAENAAPHQLSKPRTKKKKKNINEDLSVYIKSLNRKDFFSIATLGIFSVALFELIYFFRAEPVFESINIRIVGVWIVAFAVLISHILFIIDHQRVNGCLGRAMHGQLIGYGFIIFKVIHDYIFGEYSALLDFLSSDGFISLFAFPIIGLIMEIILWPLFIVINRFL